MQEANPVSVPRYYLSGVGSTIKQFKLTGYCDASSKVYATVVYLYVETNGESCMRILSSKTRVAPTTTRTIPRLELLSALLLSRLVTNITSALQQEMSLQQPLCFIDSKAVLYWIKGLTKEWKQFVQNRMEEIRRLLLIECWRHCPGVSNPADIPSRGSKPSDLISNPLWWNVPEIIDHEEVTVEQVPIPDECLNEMKSSHDKVHSLLVNGSNRLSSVIHCEDFSVLGRLLRVIAYVFRSTRLLVARFKWV